MLLTTIIAAEGGSTWGTIWPLLLIGGAMVLMMVMTIIPQKKRQKKAQEMMSKLKAGDKIKTIGGFIGEVNAVDEANNCLIINIGTEANKVLVSIDKAAVYTVLNNIQENAQKVAEVAKEEGATTADDLAVEKKKAEKSKKKVAAEETPFEETVVVPVVEAEKVEEVKVEEVKADSEIAATVAENKTATPAAKKPAAKKPAAKK